MLCGVCHVSPPHGLMRESLTFQKLCSLVLFRAPGSSGSSACRQAEHLATFVYTDVFCCRESSWSMRAARFCVCGLAEMSMSNKSTRSMSVPVDINVVGEHLFIVSVGEWCSVKNCLCRGCIPPIKALNLVMFEGLCRGGGLFSPHFLHSVTVYPEL